MEAGYKIERFVRQTAKMSPHRSTSRLVLAPFWVALAVGVVHGKSYENCELAAELHRLGAPREQISTWVCIVQHESNYNTSAVGPPNWDGSRDHGLFQINDRYWCSPPGFACGVDCKSLEDDDIADDWKCVRRIFKATRLSEGDGFKAWAVYGPSCSGDTSSYVSGCAHLSRAVVPIFVPQQALNLPVVPPSYVRIRPNFWANPFFWPFHGLLY